MRRFFPRCVALALSYTTRSGPAAASADAPSVREVAASDTVGCAAIPGVRHLNADTLLAEFIRRDAAGELGRTGDDWFARAHLCPGSESAPRELQRISGYRWRIFAHRPDTVRAAVEWDQLGYADPDSARGSDRRLIIDTLVAVRTAEGWRIATHPALYWRQLEPVTRTGKPAP
jgi:hypothetical protein